MTTRGDLLSGKHEARIKCWFNVGPASQTLAQHCPSIGYTSHISAVSPCTTLLPSTSMHKRKTTQRVQTFFRMYFPFKQMFSSHQTLLINTTAETFSQCWLNSCPTDTLSIRHQTSFHSYASNHDYSRF